MQAGIQEISSPSGRVLIQEIRPTWKFLTMKLMHVLCSTWAEYKSAASRSDATVDFDIVGTKIASHARTRPCRMYLIFGLVE